MALDIVRTVADLRSALRARALAGIDPERGVGLVPTMGALHEGHARMIDAAREASDVVVVTIFVNPLQFGDPLDLERYPRTLEADVGLLTERGADLVFAPDLREMYPSGTPQVWVRTGAMGDALEGVGRPGHFDGVATVVAKLFHAAAPPAPVAYRAFFGQKDAQQLAIVRRMVRDLDFGVEIVPVPIVRAEDGVALSSRNQLLSGEERAAARVLSRALFGLADQARDGDSVDIEAARDLVRDHPGARLEYLEVVDPETLEPLARHRLSRALDGPALALVAATVGGIRLIDNMVLGAGA